MHAETQNVGEVYDFVFYYHFCFLEQTFTELLQASLICQVPPSKSPDYSDRHLQQAISSPAVSEPTAD